MQIVLCTGILIKAITDVAADAVFSRKSINVLQEVVDAPCRDAEIVQLGTCLMSHCLDLVSSRPGVSVMSKLAEKLVSAIKHISSIVKLLLLHMRNAR